MPDFASYDKLTLVTALIIAVIALWRKLQEKDRTIAEAIRILEKSTDATAAMAAALERLRKDLPTAKSASSKPPHESMPPERF